MSTDPGDTLPDEPINAWQRLGLGREVSADLDAPPVAWDQIRALAAGELNEERASIVAEFVQRYRSWQDAFRIALIETRVRRENRTPVVQPSIHEVTRTWLFGALRGLLDTRIAEDPVSARLAEALDRSTLDAPNDRDVDLWVVLLDSLAVSSPRNETVTDAETVGETLTSPPKIPRSIAAARQFLAITRGRLRSAQDWQETELVEIAYHRLAGRSVEEIAHTLEDDPVIIRAGLRIIRERWSTVDEQPVETP